MDLSFSVLMSSLIIGLIGTALFMIGKRLGRPIWMGAGALMCIYPYFITDQWICWGVTLVLLVPVWTCRRA